MIRKTTQLAAAALAMSYAGSAYAIFDVQVLAGKRWYEIEMGNEKRGVASQEVGVAAHVDPIPLVPVAFGASVALGNLRKEDLGKPKEAKTFEAAVEIMGWLPMVPVVTPYARFKYPVVGTWATKSDATVGGVTQEVAAVYKLSGYHLNVGIKYSPLPIVKLLLEAGMASQTYKEDEIKIAGVKNTNKDSKSYDMGSKTVLLGVEIGL